MLRSFILLFSRGLARQFTYSFINIMGLAIGLSCSLIIFLYVFGEWSYDKDFANSNRIYRVGVSFFNMGNFANGPERLLTVLPSDFAGIETATRIRRERNLVLTVGDREVRVANAYHTDTAFFHVFNHEFLAGNPNEPLNNPADLVLTEATALKLFGKIDGVGEVVLVGTDKAPHTVTAIVKEPTFKTHLHADIWLSNQSLLQGDSTWSSAAYYNYVLLRNSSTEDALTRAVDRLIDTYVFPEAGRRAGFKTAADYRANENSVKFNIVALPDIYLKSKLSLELAPGGNETNLYVFSAISLFILILAAVNFMNLTTARAARRAREVGIRKTLGTSRTRLVGQFLLESVLTTTLAMVVALVLSEFFLAVFGYIAGSELMPTIWHSPLSLLLYFGFSSVVGLFAGLYPAFYLTSFLPARVLKGNVSVGGGAGFRNLLVVFQFSVSSILIICTVIVVQQLRFMQLKDLGFDQQNEVTIDNATALGASVDTYKNELARESGVLVSSFHGGEPGSKRILTFYTFQTQEMPQAVTINTYFGDADYIPLMGYHIIEGRNFMRDRASDTSAIILNEAAVRKLGLGAHPIGATINKNQTVIGVVADFHWESLRNSIAPTTIVMSKDKWEIGFRLSARSAADFLKKAEARWKELAPQEPFRYHFLDSNFGEMLEKERVFGKAITFFTALAIFISCLGLFGLAAFTSEQRTREIGIRKVLGATAGDIVILLNRNFTRLVVVAMIISLPVAYFVANIWRDGFAYKAPLTVLTFVGSVFAALIIAWVTVSYHSLKAASINPADTIKYE